MITVFFDEKNEYARAAGLWQWDYGQVLRIQGLTLPTAVEIHFSLTETGGQAITRVGVTRDGVTEVVIPDSMLENGPAAGSPIYNLCVVISHRLDQRADDPAYFLTGENQIKTRTI